MDIGFDMISSMRGQKCSRNPLSMKITNCIFIDNKATIVGQAIHSSLKLTIRNISIFAKEMKGSSTHLQMDGERVTLSDIKLVTKNTGIIQSGLTKRGIAVVSADIQIVGTI